MDLFVIFIPKLLLDLGPITDLSYSGRGSRSNTSSNRYSKYILRSFSRSLLNIIALSKWTHKHINDGETFIARTAERFRSKPTETQGFVSLSHYRAMLSLSAWIGCSVLPHGECLYAIYCACILTVNLFSTAFQIFSIAKIGLMLIGAELPCYCGLNNYDVGSMSDITPTLDVALLSWNL